jgi:acyl-CoA reductase-like NAD-dependent aldehyde dehydrogenase
LASVYLQTEIFGPSLGIHTVSTLEEAAVIANASHYGLVASVFTRREENFRELWKRLRYGGIHWNAGTLHREPLTPSAGLRRSRKASPIVKSFNSYMNHAVLSIECEQPGAYFPDSPPGLGS